MNSKVYIDQINYFLCTFNARCNNVNHQRAEKKNGYCLDLV